MNFEEIKNLKAALYTGGNEEELIKQAVLMYRDPSKEKHLDSLTISIKDKSIKITNMPGLMIDDEWHGNLILIAEIEKVLSQWERLPNSIDFFDLICKKL